MSQAKYSVKQHIDDCEVAIGAFMEFKSYIAPKINGLPGLAVSGRWPMRQRL